MKMTNEEIHVLKDAIDAFSEKIYNYYSKNKTIFNTIPANEIAEINRFLINQYRLLATLDQYEQNILKYTELQNDLIINK
jgi:hypothetical protein